MLRKPVELALLSGAALAAQGCVSWQRVGSERTPKPDAVVPAIFDASVAYRQMGFLAQGPPVAFVAGVRYLAGPTPDSTLALVCSTAVRFGSRLRMPSGMRLPSVKNGAGSEKV